MSSALAGPDILEELRERIGKGQPNGDDKVILTGTEAVELANRLEQAEAEAAELDAHLQWLKSLADKLFPEDKS